MKKLIITVFMLVLVGAQVRAQDGEYGITAGFAGYQGDIAEQAIGFGDAIGGGGLFFRYHFNERNAIRVNANYILISGDDTEADDRFRQVDRAITFRNQIIEVGANYQFNILPFVAGSPRYRFAPYLFAGAAFVSHNPQGVLFEEWYDLAPLATEGEEYSTSTFAIPYGIGANFSLGRNLVNVGVELSHRFTFTDYLDDVSDSYSNQLDELASGTGDLNPDVKRQLLLSVPSVLTAYPNAQSIDDIPDEIVRDAASNAAGKVRGNPDRNDGYWYLGFTVSKSIRRMFY